MQVSIDKQFCGPLGSGNGGYSAGLFAQVIDGPASVTLHAPPPLQRPITVEPADGDGFVAQCDAVKIATVQPASVDISPPEIPGAPSVRLARERYIRENDPGHPFPHCFVCGVRREDGDGLRIFTGPIEGSEVNADYWTPADNFGDEDGFVRPEFVWSALDCPGGIALRTWPTMALLGRLGVEIKRRPKTGEQLLVAGWRTGQDGRKHFSSSALFDADGRVIAASNAVWIELHDSKMLERLKEENE